MSTKKVTMSFRTTEDQKLRILDWAKDHGMGQSEAVRWLVNRGLEAPEEDVVLTTYGTEKDWTMDGP